MDKEEKFNRFVELRLGISDLEIELLTRSETRHASDLMVSQVQSSLEVFSRDLDPFLYDRAAFVDALSRLCLTNRKARIRFLVQEPLAAIHNCQRLVELGRRLSSSIEFRQPHADYRQYNEAFMVADQCGFIHRPFADRFEGVVNFYDPIEARRKLDFFTEVWERSEPHPEFRRLYL
jgi:hypothetical protein